MRPVHFLAAALLFATGCPSAYDRTYEREMQTLETQKRAADAESLTQYAEASKYAAVVYFAVGSAVVDSDGQRELGWFVDKLQPYPQAVILLHGLRGFDRLGGVEPHALRRSGERGRRVPGFAGHRGPAPGGAGPRHGLSGRIELHDQGTAETTAASR